MCVVWHVKTEKMLGLNISTTVFLIGRDFPRSGVWLLIVVLTLKGGAIEIKKKNSGLMRKYPNR